MMVNPDILLVQLQVISKKIYIYPLKETDSEDVNGWQLFPYQEMAPFILPVAGNFSLKMAFNFINGWQYFSLSMAGDIFPYQRLTTSCFSSSRHLYSYWWAENFTFSMAGNFFTTSGWQLVVFPLPFPHRHTPTWNTHSPAPLPKQPPFDPFSQIKVGPGSESGHSSPTSLHRQIMVKFCSKEKEEEPLQVYESEEISGCFKWRVSGRGYGNVTKKK